MVGSVKVRKTAPKQDEGAHDKADAHGRTVVFVIPRQAVPQDYGTSVRQTETDVLLNVLIGVLGGTYHKGDVAFYIRLPDIAGDAEWCSKHILRRYYLDQPKSDGAIKALADRIVGDVKGMEGQAVGYSMLEGFLKARIMQYDRYIEE